MIVHRMWTRRENGGLTIVYCEGWYLFGIIPLYLKEIRDTEGTLWTKSSE